LPEGQVQQSSRDPSTIEGEPAEEFALRYPFFECFAPPFSTVTDPSISATEKITIKFKCQWPIDSIKDSLRTFCIRLLRLPFHSSHHKQTDLFGNYRTARTNVIKVVVL
jgi:hypothetical protein